MDTIKEFQYKVDTLSEKRVKQILKNLLHFVDDSYNYYHEYERSKSVSVGFAITSAWLFNQIKKGE